LASPAAQDSSNPCINDLYTTTNKTHLKNVQTTSSPSSNIWFLACISSSLNLTGSFHRNCMPLLSSQKLYPVTSSPSFST
jgi:hypothetical protein